MSISLAPQKTLAEITLESGKKRYVALETASKITGYTADYLKRLCDLYRLPYRLCLDGDYAIEVEALLRETQTILISYEGIPFLDTEGLLDPHPQSTIVADESTPADSELASSVSEELVEGISVSGFPEGIRMRSAEESRAGVLSFVGRSVISDSDHPLAEEELNAVPVHIPIVDVSLHGVTVFPHSPVSEESTAIAVPESVPQDVPLSSVSSMSSSASGVRAVSAYRPITTSIDPTFHHDSSPLFPSIPDKSLLSPPSLSEEKPIEIVPPPSLPPAPALKKELPPSESMAQILRSVPELTGVFSRQEITPPSAPLLKGKIASSRQVLQHSSVGVFHTFPVKSLPSKKALPLLVDQHPALLRARTLTGVAALVIGIGLTTFFGISVARHPSPVSYDGSSVTESLAGVGAASNNGSRTETATTAPPVCPPSSTSRVFSDDVSLHVGENGKVEIRPIFRDRVGNPVND